MSIPEADRRFRELIVKPEKFTAEEIRELRGLLAKLSWASTEPSQTARAQFRAMLDLADAIRDFDDASARLVNVTNALTRRGLWLSGVALVVAAASLLVSVIALMK